MIGTWVGPGSAVRNTSRTSRRKSIKIGTFPAGQLYHCHPFSIAIWITLVPGFSRAGKKNTTVTPFINATEALYLACTYGVSGAPFRTYGLKLVRLFLYNLDVLRQSMVQAALCSDPRSPAN